MRRKVVCFVDEETSWMITSTVSIVSLFQFSVFRLHNHGCHRCSLARRYRRYCRFYFSFLLSLSSVLLQCYSVTVQKLIIIHPKNGSISIYLYIIYKYIDIDFTFDFLDCLLLNCNTVTL